MAEIIYMNSRGLFDNFCRLIAGWETRQVHLFHVFVLCFGPGRTKMTL